MRMRKIVRKKCSTDFKNGVAALDDLLRKRQIRADEDVDIWREALRECHDRLREK
jgi:hypothetical protein